MENDVKVITAFLALNAGIIAFAMLLYVQGGMDFQRILGYLLTQFNP